MREPTLNRVERGTIAYWTDAALHDELGVVVAFSERTGGASQSPYDSLNLGAHVGDAACSVDENRIRLLESIGIGDLRQALTTCEQVHGALIHDVGPAERGAGAFASSTTMQANERANSALLPSISGCDALVTSETGIPLLLFFADCVPVVLVAPGPTVAVVHAGWRGALGDLPGLAVCHLVSSYGVEASSVRAYIGPHIGACHYEVSAEILSLFTASFGNLARAESGGLDLGAVVTSSLIRSGVDSCCIAALGTCTAESTECFYSYRAEGGLTGRHGALACILPQS